MAPRFKNFNSHGIREPLTNRIAGILDEYPDGTQIARELLQNSDDARSKVQWYLLDHHDRRDPSSGDVAELRLFHEDLAEYMGPALLAGSDSLFEEKDFLSMKNLAASEKKNDETKIGQMGIGFNSIYHMTDCPSFISGDQFMVIEPHERIFNGKSQFSEGAVRGTFVADREGLNEFPDQLKSFAVLEDIDFSVPYPGTIFRFPLRTKDQAQTSKLSKNAYPAEQVLKMLLKLKDEALKGILFLKHIERIVIYERMEYEEVPTKLFEIEIINAREVSQKRQQLLANLKAHVYPESTASRDAILEYSIRPIFRLTQGDGSVTEESWHITTMVGNVLTAHAHMEETTDGEGDLSNHKLIPWVGIAAPTAPGVKIDSSRLFCFLPIGIQLPFPVHINGHFAVKQSRREIWTNQDNDFAKHASAYIKSAWNVHLFKSHVPVVYAKFLESLGLARGANYDLWPVSCGEGLGLDSIWKELLVDLAREACDENLEVFFSRSAEKGELHMVSYQSSWVASPELEKYPCLVEALQGLIDLIVGLPTAVLGALHRLVDEDEVEDRILTPAIVRQLLRTHKSEWSSVATDETKVEMLKYCIEDDDIADLEGLPLLPLAGELWVEFSQEHSGSRHIATVMIFKVLKYSNEGLVDINIDRQLTEYFRDEKHKKKFQLFWSPLMLSAFVQRIHGIYQRLYYKDEPRTDSSMAQPDNEFPTDDWIRDFWAVVDRNQRHNPNIFLAILNGIHLLPITRNRLAPLSESMPVVYMEPSESKGEPSLAPFFAVLDEELECRVLRPGFMISTTGNYVVNVSDVVEVIGVMKNVPDDRLWRLQQGHCQTVCDYMARWLDANEELNEDQIHVLKTLPIYKTYDESKLVSLRNPTVGKTKWRVAWRFTRAKNPWLPASVSLLEDGQPMLEHLTELIGLSTIQEAEYWSLILPNLESYPEEEWDTMFERFCEKYHVHSKDSDYDFPSIMRDIPFVLTSGPNSSSTDDQSHSGPRLSPQSVINRSLSAYYLDHEDVFPCGVYAQSFVLNVLREMGMQLEFDTDLIIDRVRVLSGHLMKKDSEKRNGILRAFYTRINADFSGIFKSKNMQNTLRSLPWILASTLGDNDCQLYKPEECRPSSDISLVGSQMPLAKFICTNEALNECMGWNASPPLDKVLAHFQVLINRPSKSSGGSSPSEVEFSTIYRYLLKQVSDATALSVIKKVLGSKAWILINGTLHTTDRVALNVFQDLSPHFVQIASPGFEPLFLAMGVRDTVRQEDLQEIISVVALRYGEKGVISDADAELVVNKLLPSMCSGAYKWNEDLLILTEDKKLRKISEVVYDDVNARRNTRDPWKAEDDTSQYTFTSSMINLYTATYLQIPMFSTKCWVDQQDSTFEAWEQEEDIVDRIKSILNDYDPSNIFAEFLQNATDSGATKCTFMLDNRSFGRGKVLSKDMACWQGPALVIYNNAEFKEEDFKALSKLGVGSKQDDSSKIGRHGLGFNAVYHFTDVPSVVSGSHIGFFDPRMEYLPEKRTPGGRIRQRGQRCNFLNLNAEALSDQLAPYKGLFDCDMESHFRGTIFRLPLRTLDVQLRSGKSMVLGEQWTLTQIQDMMRLWVEDSKVAMLFLTDLRIIEINDSDKLSCCVTKTMGTRPMEQALCINTDSSVSTQIVDIRLEGSDFQKPESRRWLVHSAQDFPQNTDVSIKELAQKNHWNPHCGIALNLSLNSRGHSFKGRIFTHLPTLIHTGLPFHIHGDFALTSNRKNLAGGSDERDQKSKWNKFLMGECLPRTAASAFVKLLGYHFRAAILGGPRPSEIDFATESYFRFWPAASEGRGDIIPFVLGFLRKSHTSPIFPTRQQGKSTIMGTSGQNVVFPGSTKAPRELLPAIREKLQSRGIHICDCPWNLQEHIQKGWGSNPELPFDQVDANLIRKIIRDDPLFIPIHVTSTEGKRWILEYTLMALVDPKEVVAEPIDGLALLPLVNGEWKPLLPTSLYYTAKPEIRELIKGSTVLVDESLFRSVNTESKASEKKTISRLESILVKLVKNPAFGVTEIPPAIFSSMVCTEYPNGIRDDLRNKFWRLLEKYTDQAQFGELPLLKTLDGSMRPLKDCCRGLEISHMAQEVKSNVERIAPMLRDLGFILFNANDNEKNPYLIANAPKCDNLLVTKAIARICKNRPLSRAVTKDQAAVLRDMIKASGSQLKPEAESLGLLRIWPSWSTSQQPILIQAHGSYYMQGNYDLTSLGEYRDVIKCEHYELFSAMGASPLSLVSAFESRVLPMFHNKSLTCTGATKDAYLNILRLIVKNAGNSGKKADFPAKQVLQTGRIILARDNTFHSSKELYDQDDALLSVIFANENSRFAKTAFWDMISPKKHLFSFRNHTDPSMVTEVATHVLELTQGRTSLTPDAVRSKAVYLVQYIYGTKTTTDWMDQRWAIVPGEVAQNPPYNEYVPLVGDYLPFSQLIDPLYRDIAWTQCALFPDNLKPSQQFKTCFPTVGIPSIGVVIDHLAVLVTELAPIWTSTEKQLTLKIALFKVYKALDDYAAVNAANKDTLKRLLTDKMKKPYILNGDHKDPSLPESWLWPSQLMLDIDNNIERHQVVHAKLQPLRKLLVAIGVEQMQKVEGSVNVPEGRKVGDIESRLLNCFETQDQPNGFMDVRFKFSSGHQIMAHKFMLAHSNDYFARRFTGAWAGYITREPSEPGVEVIDLSMLDETYETFWGLIHYFYTDQLIFSNGPPVPSLGEKEDTNNGVSVDELRDRVQYLMGLQRLADQYETPRLKALIALEVVAGQKVIHSNVFNVRAHAIENQSNDIKEHCEKYLRKNSSSVRTYITGEMEVYKKSLEELMGDGHGAERAELRDEIKEMMGHLAELNTLA